jgi:hypothetical protein
LTIAPPREDKADSDRGFLEVINITLMSTRIEGNRAVEGGGVWSAWPMLVVNTTVRNNTAEKAVSNADCLRVDIRGLRMYDLGPPWCGRPQKGGIPLLVPRLNLEGVLINIFLYISRT